MSIVSMKKVILVAPLSNMEKILRDAYRAGIIHLVPIKDKSEKKKILLKEKKDKLLNINSSIRALNKVLSLSREFENNPQSHSSDKLVNNNLLSDVYKIDNLLDRRAELTKQLSKLHDGVDKFKVWGDFDPKIVRSLEKDTGFSIKLSIIEKNKWGSLDKRGLFFEEISETTDKVYLLIIHKDHVKDIVGIEFPYASLNELKTEIDKINKEIFKINNSLKNMCSLEPIIRKEIIALQKEYDIIDAENNLYKFDNLFGMEGYIPYNKEKELMDVFIMQKVVIHFKDPIENDNVPLLLDNNKLFKGFELLIKLFSGLSYHEKDVTPLVGLLFMFFGSLCLMDAGYGIVGIILGMTLRYYGVKDLGIIALLTGITTTIVGAVNGQIFGLIVGQDIFHNSQPLMTLATDPLYCFRFSLMVGLAAVFLSHLTAVYVNGWKTASTGSLIMAFGIIFYLLAQNYSLNVDTKNIIFFTIIALSIISWVAYPEVIFSIKIPNIIWTLYSGSTGLIQDILSHMRLFGISLSGAILAIVVNEISYIFPFYIQIPFCFIGHIFVFALALLSLYVHTNRLIFYEFGSKCIKGGNYYYLPFGRS